MGISVTINRGQGTHNKCVVFLGQKSTGKGYIYIFSCIVEVCTVGLGHAVSKKGGLCISEQVSVYGMDSMDMRLVIRLKRVSR